MLAFAALATLGVCAWGCTDLASDCNLNLDCPGTPQPMCTGFYAPDDPCGICMQGYCCETLAACNTDGFCLGACFFGLWPLDPGCSQPPSAAPFKAITSCQTQFCGKACAPVDICNPVNNSGCPGDYCDTVNPGIFYCTGNIGTPVPLCAACDPTNGPFCDADLHCDPVSHTCARFCCDDGDCGTGNKCVTDPKRAFGATLPDSKITAVGTCLTQDESTAACDAPMTAPSMGKCAPTF
jgi:hypothetical protein